VDKQHESLVGSHVLLVEDDGLTAFETADVLNSWGCTVLGPVPTASDAIEVIEMQTPDVAVLDVELRDGTSAPIVEALEKRNCPYILLTAADENKLPLTMRQADRLQKPLDERKLRTLLAQLVDS
jgi:DNA-binding response OmpR family regulator